jgi:hypothetical protein
MRITLTLKVSMLASSAKHPLLPNYLLRIYLTSKSPAIFLTRSMKHQSLPRRIDMTCSRCHGLMVREHLLDFEGTYGHMWTNGYRCMNCGNVHDPVIEQHRLAKVQPTLILVTDKADHKEDELYTESHSVVMRAA